MLELMTSKKKTIESLEDKLNNFRSLLIQEGTMSKKISELKENLMDSQKMELEQNDLNQPPIFF